MAKKEGKAGGLVFASIDERFGFRFLFNTYLSCDLEQIDRNETRRQWNEENEILIYPGE